MIWDCDYFGQDEWGDWDNFDYDGFDVGAKSSLCILRLF
jgi:hypothetical protein